MERPVLERPVWGGGVEGLVYPPPPPPPPPPPRCSRCRHLRNCRCHPPLRRRADTMGRDDFQVRHGGCDCRSSRPGQEINL
jgi:hypothetical protein